LVIKQGAKAPTYSEQENKMKLGKTQQAVLEALKRHKGYYASCGWVWTTHKQTVAILDSLVRKGLATVGTDPFWGITYKAI